MSQISLLHAWRCPSSPCPPNAAMRLGRRNHRPAVSANPRVTGSHGRCLWAAPAVGRHHHSRQPSARMMRICSAATMADRAALLADQLQQRKQRNDGPASVLAIGTANPKNCMPQDEYTDWYFRVTNSDHLTDLKDKMKRICERTDIEKRYYHLTEDILRAHPEFLDPEVPSLDARLDILGAVVPELIKDAAAKAISEWGRPAGDITHVVVSTMSDVRMPGADLRVAALLGFSPSVQRVMLYLHGCSAGSSALRVAKDIAENNRGARVLVAVADVGIIGFRAPDEAHMHSNVLHALFGDGAAAVIVGAGPLEPAERTVFEMVFASQITIPGTEKATTSQYSKAGLDFHVTSNMPKLIGHSIEQCLVDALAPLGLAGGGWNSLFWAVHPGGRKILDSYEAALGLEPGKLAASRKVLREYGNMGGVTIIFVLDELRRRRRDDEEGEGQCEWGVMVGLGPGVTVEMMALHACIPPAIGAAGAKEN